MERVRTNAGQTLGIIGLVLGIISFIISFIPCIGIIALVPGIIAIIVSIIGLVHANRNNGAKGLNIAALVVSGFGLVIASFWIFFFVGISKLDEGEIENMVHDVIKDAVEESMNNPDLQIKLEELEQQLDELELDSIPNEIDSVKIKLEIETNKK